MQDKRQKLLGKLGRGLLYSTPLLVASIGIGQAVSAENASPSAYEQPAGEAEAKKEAKGEGEAKMMKAKGEAEAKGEGEAEAKGEGEAKGEAEGEAEGNPKDIKRPMFSKKYKGDTSNLVAKGKELYGDTSLSTNGLSCNSCHTDMAGYNDTFKKAYPHYVAMGKDIYRQKKLTAESMVQVCMQQPMEAKALPWDSEKLAALTAYVEVLQKEYAAK